MKKSGNIFLFRLSLCLLICYLTKETIVILLCGFYLFFEYKRSILIFAAVFSVLLLWDEAHIDFLPYGYIKESAAGEIVIDKFLYEMQCDDDIPVGSIVYSKEQKIRPTGMFLPMKVIYEKASFLPDQRKDYVYSSLFGIYGSSPFSYICFPLVSFLMRKKRIAGWVLLLLFILFFGFDPRYFLLIRYLISEPLISFSCSILFFLFFKPSVFYQNYFRYFYLFWFISLIDISFKKSLSFAIQSVLFGKIRILPYLDRKLMIDCCLLFFLCDLFMLGCGGFALTDMLCSSLNYLIHLGINGKMSIFCLLPLMIPFKKDSIRVFIMLLLLISPLQDPFCSLNFVDVGQGDCIVLITPFHRKVIMIDTGSPYNYFKVKDFLDSHRIKCIDTLILTHADSDHNGNEEAICKDYLVNEVLHDGKDLWDKTFFMDNLELETEGNENDDSLVYRLDLSSLHVLLTADISAIKERELLIKYDLKDIDILKVSHHGSSSATSSYFVSRIMPEYAVISTSGAYGHPDGEVLEHLRCYGVDTFVTRDCGDVSILVFKDWNLLKTEKNHFVIIRS